MMKLLYVKFELMRFTYGCEESGRLIDIYRTPKARDKAQV